MPKKKKRPPLWFEDPYEDVRKMEEQFHKQMAEFWKRPMRFTIKFPKTQRIARGIPLNLRQTENNLIIRAQLPGFKKDEINLKVTSRTINISAEKKTKRVEKGKEFYMEKASAGSMRRFLTLPVEVRADEVKAKFENGILEVVMPKKEKVVKKKEKRVRIQ